MTKITKSPSSRTKAIAATGTKTRMRKVSGVQAKSKPSPVHPMPKGTKGPPALMTERGKPTMALKRDNASLKATGKSYPNAKGSNYQPRSARANKMPGPGG